MSARLPLLASLAGFTFCMSAFAQQGPQACGAAPAIMRSTQPNIFSEQQEQWLGEAMADQMDRFSQPIRNPALNAYMAKIGDRLLAGLPKTDLHFTYTLVESSEVNGFSLAGGRVYLTRKLVASAHSEDEIAGVIGHEMGHILTHQFAIETTADMKRLLGITSVSDRADVYKKFQMLVDARMKDKHPTDPETDDAQDQADRVAVFATAAAGYRPAAYAEFWDRSFFVGGKTGSALGDFFHATSPSQKRLRRIRGIVAELPAGCGTAKEVAANPAFQAWQRDVLENQAVVAEKSSEVLSKAADKAEELNLQLAPIRMDVDRLRFSRDGKDVLAQDESSIFVLSREPFKELFRFDAEDALPAEFTPDSQGIVFMTSALHVERWNIPEHKLAAAAEVVPKEECLQTVLAPDGRSMVCIYVEPGDAIGLSLIDVETSNVLFAKKEWFPGIGGGHGFQLNVDDTMIANSSFSGDGNVMMIGLDWNRLAFDLRTRTLIKIGGLLKSALLPSFYFCFQGSDKVLLANLEIPADSGVVSFPEGKRLSKFKVPLEPLRATTGGEFAITPGPKDYQVAITDFVTNKYVQASRAASLDMLGDYFIGENADGTLALLTTVKDGPGKVEKATLSESPISRSRSISLSPDGRYLAFSAHTRSTIWDIESGKQAFLAHGFNGASWTPEGKLLAEFAKRPDSAHAVRQLTISPAKAEDFTYKLPDDAHLLLGHLFERKKEKNVYSIAALSPLDGKEQWKRSFVNSSPDYTTNIADTDLIFDYWLESAAGKERVNADARLKDKAAAIKDKSLGRLIEVVNSNDGTTRAQTLIEIPPIRIGVNGFEKSGDLLYLSTEDNRTIVYSMLSGAQLRQFFGMVVALDSETGLICTVNRRDEITAIDKGGKELAHFKLASPLRFARLREHGSKLYVFTADQRIHRFKVGS